MTKTEAKEQAGKELLAAVDAYVYAVLAVRSEEKALAENKRFRESSEKFRKMLSRPPEGKPGSYERTLRESINS